MYTGMIYNMFVCFIAGISGLVVFWQIRRIRAKKEMEYSQGLDYFLLFFGILWILVGIRIFFAWLGRPDLDMFIWNWFTGPLTYIHIIPLFYFFGWALLKNKRARLLFNGFFTAITLLTVVTLFLYGSAPGEITYWGTKPVANELTHKIFTYGIFLPIIFCIFGDLFKRLRNWMRTGNPFEKQLFGFDLGISIYALIAIFDGLALVRGWTLLLVRIGIMVSSLIIYLSATGEIEE